jgi:hypothetical protein
LLHYSYRLKKYLNDVDSTDNMSGIEMTSPHKEISTAKEFPCNIPAVG